MISMLMKSIYRQSDDYSDLKSSLSLKSSHPTTTPDCVIIGKRLCRGSTNMADILSEAEESIRIKEESNSWTQYTKVAGVFFSVIIIMTILVVVILIIRKRKLKQFRSRNRSRFVNPNYQPSNNINNDNSNGIDFDYITKRVPQIKKDESTLNNNNNYHHVDDDGGGDDDDGGGDKDVKVADRSTKKGSLFTFDSSQSFPSHKESILGCGGHDGDDEGVKESDDDDANCEKGVYSGSYIEGDITAKVAPPKNNKGTTPTSPDKLLSQTQDKLQKLQQKHQKQQIKWQQRLNSLQHKRQQLLLTQQQQQQQFFLVLPHKGDYRKCNQNENISNDCNKNSNSNIHNYNKNNNKNTINNANKNKSDNDDDDEDENDVRTKLLSKKSTSLDSYDRTLNPFFKDEEGK